VTVTPGRVPVHLLSQASAEKWQTVRSALDSWSRTIRFCVMMLVMTVPLASCVLLVRWHW
jgi:type IV secretory pathway component VirB8